MIFPGAGMRGAPAVPENFVRKMSFILLRDVLRNCFKAFPCCITTTQTKTNKMVEAKRIFSDTVKNKLLTTQIHSFIYVTFIN